MLGKVLALSSLGSFVLLSALLYTTSPSTVHPAVILFVFLLIYVLALGTLTFLIYVGVRVVAARRIHQVSRQNESVALLRRVYLYASVLGLAPVMILGMQSIGQLNVYEVGLVGLFEVVACFYITKQR